MPSIILACSAGQAKAYLAFRNGTSDVLMLTFQYYSPSTCSRDGLKPWRTIGWFQIMPGETKIVLRANLQPSEEYFWYAESKSGPVWNGLWNYMAVPLGRFDWCYGTGTTSDQVRNVGFRQLLTGHKENYTLNISEGARQRDKWNPPPRVDGGPVPWPNSRAQ